jgi:hypothetical protein
MTGTDTNATAQAPDDGVMGMDAPERIWGYPSYITGWNNGNAFNRKVIGGTEYVRADLASPLEAVAMRDAALKAIMDIWAELWPKMAELELQHPAQPEIDAICAIPLPDHAAMLAAALKLPEVAAMVDAAMGVIARWDSPDWKSGHTLDHITKLRTALSALEAKP